MTTRWTTADIARELGLSSRAVVRYCVLRWRRKGIPLDVAVNLTTNEREYLPWQVWGARATDRKGKRTDLTRNDQPEPIILHAVADTDDTDGSFGAHIRILEDSADLYSEVDTVTYMADPDPDKAEASILRELTRGGYRVMGAPTHRHAGISMPVAKIR